MADKPNLDRAYAVGSTDDIKSLYRDWAETYDEAFVTAKGYRLAELVADAFVAAGGTGPVLDVGAGTGAVAAHLGKADISPIDALDLSQEMLDVARDKGLYRDLVAANVLEPLGPALPRRYNGIVSAGTFTHGHVGPDGIENLLDIARPRALFALSINAAHFAAKGFEAAFEQLADRISDVSAPELPIYDDRADPEHRGDTARIVTFRLR